MPDLTVPYAIPYVCQFASRDLVHAFLNEGRDVSTDPHWREYGADSPEEYAHWALRACGVVCVKMAVDGLTGQPSGTVMEWVRAGLALDGYLVERRPDRPDKRVEKGWKHAALAQLANEAGCQARLAADLSMDDLAAEIMAGHVLIASVSSELGEEVPITRRSGHLVVVYGVGLDDRIGMHIGDRKPANRKICAICVICGLNPWRPSPIRSHSLNRRKYRFCQSSRMSSKVIPAVSVSQSSTLFATGK